MLNYKSVSLRWDVVIQLESKHAIVSAVAFGCLSLWSYFPHVSFYKQRTAISVHENDSR